MTILNRIIRLWREGISDADMHYQGFLELLERLQAMARAPVQGTRVLEIGCGDRAPLSLLFAAYGAEATAVDVLPVSLGWKRRPTFWSRLARDNARGVAKQIARDALHTWRYWQHLGRRSERKLPFEAARVHQMDASALRFPDSSFDLVVSSAVGQMRGGEYLSCELKRELSEYSPRDLLLSSVTI